ncbi:phage virion morphogenesis protein [Campylobacter hyointestinalis subsp. hyointestinalis]|uniref:phage virion morphogenesis protein n=1 Tax=Campylobacter hyointestinalis TaxID=198 RepID=UPI000CE33BFD|nr:phage virion morphogenesis protein [Campylobacter hyointestinalis]PPB57594.1 phage virion morphogenesis protein [Campylobacter hyointestinalis subsp. hyointestinalis]QCT99347.1 phage virion morphogenesis protein [Campylobacter hyointestinalis subsp. hyointestinalis]
MIEVKGIEKLQNKLRNIQKLEHRTAPLMKQLGEILKNSIEDSFENEKSPFGERWKPLSQSTLKNKLKKGKSERILRRDGNLADNWVLNTTNTKASVSNNASHKGFAYGLTHQFGVGGAGHTKNIKIPARAFLPVDKSGKLASDVKREVVKEIISFIKNI